MRNLPEVTSYCSSQISNGKRFKALVLTMKASGIVPYLCFIIFQVEPQLVVIFEGYESHRCFYSNIFISRGKKLFICTIIVVLWSGPKFYVNGNFYLFEGL